MVVRKVISLLAEGVRDGAAARAASDNLYTERGGKVSATLNIISADLHTHTLLITRNNPNPAYLAMGDQDQALENARRISGCTHLLQIAHELERVGDRATNIAERVIYSVTGELSELNL